jgi:MoxR-like ATPase
VADEAGRDPSEEQLAAALDQLKVSDLLVHTLSTISSLAYHRLAEEHRDVEQARLAIEALRALVPVLRDAVPDDLVRDFEQVTTSLQLAYADAVGSGTP